MKFKKSLKKLLWLLLICAVLSAIAVFFCNKKIIADSKPYLYENIDNLPVKKAGLLLGTSKYLANGKENLYYRYRIDAAIALYNSQKIKYIVVSGDNSRKTYDEPSQMKSDLMAGGVPESAIFLDYAGFRTLDSVIRMKKIFGQNDFVVISQKFHNERAVYIALKYGLNVLAFNAKDVSKYYGLKTDLREKFARVKVFIDFLTDKQPKFLGEKIYIE